MTLRTPLIDTARARDELGWQPSISAGEALLDLMAGMQSRRAWRRRRSRRAAPVPPARASS